MQAKTTQNMAQTIPNPVYMPIASGYVALVHELCTERGISTESLFDRTGIDPSVLESTEASFTGEQFRTLINNALALTRDPDFGISYGLRLSIGTHGLLGYGFMCSQTIESALELMIKYHKLVFSIIEMQLDRQPERPVLRVELAPGMQDIEPVIVDSFFSGLHTTARFLMGNAPSIIREARVRHARPRPAFAYEQVFDYPVRFGCSANELVFRADILKTPMPTHDPRSTKMVMAHCERQLRELTEYHHLPCRVEKLLRASQSQLPGLEELAQQLHMHPRTLGRQLGKYDTSYRLLLDKVRAERALEYLAYGDLSIEDIALKLNFNNTSSFYRAFKRWTGHTPRYYRLSRSSEDDQHPALDHSGPAHP